MAVAENNDCPHPYASRWGQRQRCLDRRTSYGCLAAACDAPDAPSLVELWHRAT